MGASISTVVAVAFVVAATAAVARAAGLERPWLQPWAVLRAVMQLGLLSLVLVGVVRSITLTVALLLIGVVAAAWTATGRMDLPRRWTVVLAPVLAAATALPVVVVLASGALPSSPTYLLAIGGILVGNAMTAASLTGRTLRSAIVTHRDEIEGWLALGATPRRATNRLVRLAASTAILPATDQTRTTGLVALPGAFVGALFGGASVLDAARFQVLVLAGILLTGVLVAVTIGAILGAPRQIPERTAPSR